MSISDFKGTIGLVLPTTYNSIWLFISSTLKQVHAKVCNEDKCLVHDKLLCLSLVKQNYFSTWSAFEVTTCSKILLYYMISLYGYHLLKKILKYMISLCGYNLLNKKSLVHDKPLWLTLVKNKSLYLFYLCLTLTSMFGCKILRGIKD